jgi:hypothetical protein
MMIKQHVLKVLLSLGVSLLLLALLFKGLTHSAEEAVRPRLVSLLLDTSLLYVGFYFLTSFAQTFFRALRYRLILQHSDSGEVPGRWHLFIVTLSRNMFVDMLPARLGELSYIAMLNRGFHVRANACLSSLAISFVFDLLALALLLVGLLAWQILFADLRPWLFGVILLIFLVSSLLLVFLFPVLQWFTKTLSTRPVKGRLARVLQLIQETSASLEQARQAGILTQVLSLSLAVRFFKYFGLYLLFLGVLLPSFPEVTKDFASVFIALVSAEAGSALPIPTFMSFGTYEAGGALALVALGFAHSVSVLGMLALHIWSQAVDYMLGTIALILFIFTVSKPQKVGRWKDLIRTRKQKIVGLFTALLFALGLTLFGLQMREVSKMGAFRPPKPGEPVANKEMLAQASDPILAQLRGFVIWSSNRFGNHDLIMLTLPDRQLSRLTSDSHTDYFPRISPDGTKVVFARSQEPWVSQRNKYAWNTWLLDLPTGTSRLLAENANAPTWSADGRKVYFQRQANQFVEHVLATGKERVLFETGKNVPIDASLQLQTPSWSAARQSLAFTTRRLGPVYTYLLGPDQGLREVNEGCQLAWAPDSSFLYHVGHGPGRRNVFYRIDPDTLERELWFDASGSSAYRHTYFPKISNTGDVLVYGASAGGHEHDTADYEIFLWPLGTPLTNIARLSFHTSNDNWPDIFLY